MVIKIGSIVRTNKSIPHTYYGIYEGVIHGKGHELRYVSTGGEEVSHTKITYYSMTELRETWEEYIDGSG
jgi:hypothetical protein